MNVLVIGKYNQKIISIISRSKLLDKLYITDKNGANKIPDIRFDAIDELIARAKALQIDIAINLDKDLIDMNICEEFKKNKVNLISVNKKWLNLEKSKFAAKQLLMHYSINTPKIINVPLNFPIILKTDLYNIQIPINSMQELIDKMKEFEGIKTFYEEYSDEPQFDLLALWDGENIFFLNSPTSCTEVQTDRLELLKTKINFMLSDEKADFIGFFYIGIIWYKNDWYVKDFIMTPDDFPENLSANSDFIYILNAAIYQKLNEIQ